MKIDQTYTQTDGIAWQKKGSRMGASTETASLTVHATTAMKLHTESTFHNATIGKLYIATY